MGHWLRHKQLLQFRLPGRIRCHSFQAWALPGTGIRPHRMAQASSQSRHGPSQAAGTGHFRRSRGQNHRSVQAALHSPLYGASRQAAGAGSMRRSSSPGFSTVAGSPGPHAASSDSHTGTGPSKD
ncbi:hypothetical protein NDU88_005437 [Pleurodeles waltl]|uniref:Uncharacterized protein n=1 Tax=Pleurodeles waltl TaxID=8319 RepID=A0AAV7MWC0_PLEWA|nr:hypothetical protein NDU88_005437 [Pleurodeles waltl]